MTMAHSTSTNAPRTSGRITVRPRTRALTAYRAETQEVLEVGVKSVIVAPGQWVVCDGQTVLDVLDAPVFDKAYLRTETGLVLSTETRAQVETLLGPGSTRSSDEFLLALKRLARIHCGEIDLPFTPAQVEELKARADKQRIPLDAYVRRLLDRFTQDLWSL